MMKSKKLLASFLTVVSLLQFTMFTPREVKAFSASTAAPTQTASYFTNTNDNLMAEFNSSLSDGSQVDTSYTSGMTGKFSFDNWGVLNSIGGKSYAAGGLSGGYGGYLQGGMIYQSGQSKITLADLGITSSTTDVTLSFWYNWDGTNVSMPIGFTSWDLFISGGKFGINTANSDLYGIDNPFKAGQYTHVTIHIKAGNASQSEIYINGVKQAMSQQIGTTVSSTISFSSGTLCIDGWTGDANYRSNSYIDELYVWNRALSGTEVNNMFRSFEHTYTYLKDPVAKMTFEAYTVQNIINNKSYASGNNGFVSSKKKTGLQLNSQRVTVPLSDLGFTGAETYFTISFWWKSDQSRVGKFPFYIDGAGGTSLFEGGSAGNYMFGFNTGNGEIFGIPDPFTDGQYHHIVGMFYKNSVANSQIFVDGQKRNCTYLAGSSSVNSHLQFLPTGNLYLGDTGGGTYDYASYNTSTIDEVMVWNRSLSGLEVRSLYKSYSKNTGNAAMNSTFWDNYQWDAVGGDTGLDILNDSTLGTNYLHMTSNGKDVGNDSGAGIRIDSLKANTDYTFSGYFRAAAGTTWNSGTIAVANAGQTAFLGQANIDNVDITTTWVRVSVNFNTGANTTINLRLARGDHPWVDAADMKLEEGKYASPFISYNSQKTYAYGVMDNLISPHDSYFVGSTARNNWQSFNYGGVNSSSAFMALGPGGYSYYRVTPSGGTGFGDSGAMMGIPYVEPNTDYTIGAWMRIPATSADGGNGRIFVCSSNNTVGIASIFPVINGNPNPNTNGQWQWVTGTFNTGSNKSLYIRMGRGDASYMDFTRLTLQGGKNPIPSSSNGYSGNISPQTVTFVPAGNVVNHHIGTGTVTTRSATVTGTWTDSQWHDSVSEISYPSSISKDYYDAGSGQSILVNLPYTGTSQINSTTQSYSTTVAQTQTVWMNQTNLGDYKHYDPVNHTSLGYQSDNSSTYYNGQYSYYSASPRAPKDYYGPTADQGYAWTYVSSKWSADGSALYYNPYNIKVPGSLWQADKGSGYSYNSYRRGVDVTYKRYGSTTVYVAGTASKTVYMYQANYSATVNLPDSVESYQDYSVTTRWQVNLSYGGSIYPTNLHANSVSFVDMNGTAISGSVQAGQSLMARVSYINNGNYIIDNDFNINIYDETGKQIGGSVVSNGVPINVTQTLDIVFTYPTSGVHTLTAQVDDGDLVDEADEADNSASNSITFYVQNLACNFLQVVGSSDETTRASLTIGGTYRAKIGVVNTGSTNVGAFAIGLYGVQTPTSEQAPGLPDSTTKLGSNYNVASLNAGDGLGTGYTYGYAYISFVANSTDVKSYTAWVDNGQIIKESNEWDNLKSLALNTLAENVKANSINITDMSNVAVATIIQGLQYKASISFSNDQNTDLIPVGVRINDITGGTILTVAKKDYSLYSGQTITDIITFTAPITTTGSRTYQLDTDYYNAFDETNETDNTATDIVTSQKTDLQPTSINILDARDSSVVTSLIKGHNYIVRVVTSNIGTTNVGAFSLGLVGNQGLTFTPASVVSLNAGATVTSNFNFTASNSGTYSFTATSDSANVIAETDETNNTITKSAISYNVNLNATSIDIVGVSDTTSKAQVQQNKQYRAAITVTNNGETNITTPFVVALNENSVAKGTTTVNSLNAGASTVVYITFTEVNRGAVTFQAVIDSTNVIDESNESDNTVSTVRTAYRLNIKATTIDVVGASDTISKNPLTLNLSYRASITVTNDGDQAISTPFAVGFYDNTGVSTKLGTTTVASLAAGASTTVYISYIPNTAGLRTLVGIADDGGVIDESDETDNSASIQKTVNRVNIQAVSINVVDSSGVSQTTLQKGLTYYAKVTLTNDSSIALTAFNLGIYDNGVRIASLPISSMLLNASNVVYTVAFVPSNAGTRTLSAFADDNLQIAESFENDNQVAMNITVADLQLQNFRIISMVNPPSTYTYPITVPSMPTTVKSGYNVVFQVDVVGVADTITTSIYDSIGTSMGTVSFTKVVDIDATHSTWQFTWATPLSTTNGTVISMGIVGIRNSYTCNYNINNAWNNGSVVNTGKTLLISGSALEDVMINRIY
jgi:hypothetical protein